jgi:prepilin-type processing-associated H-X9-DG protein
MEQAPLVETIKAGPPPGGPSPDDATFPGWKTQIEILLCPSDTTAIDETFGHTNYCFSAGDAIIATGEGPPINPIPPGAIIHPRNPRGVFGHNSRIRFADLVDGTSNTIAMAERCVGEDQTYVKGGVVEVSGIAANPSLCAAAVSSGILAGPTHAWSGLRFHDGRGGYTAITTILPPNKQSCVDGTNPQDPGIYTPNSYHPGGVVVLFCDASVRLISDQIDAGDSTLAIPSTAGLSYSLPGKKNPYGVWGALGTRRGLEVVSGY